MIYSQAENNGVGMLIIRVHILIIVIMNFIFSLSETKMLQSFSVVLFTPQLQLKVMAVVLPHQCGVN